MNKKWKQEFDSMFKRRQPTKITIPCPNCSLSINVLYVQNYAGAYPCQQCKSELTLDVDDERTLKQKIRNFVNISISMIITLIALISIHAIGYFIVDLEISIYLKGVGMSGIFFLMLALYSGFGNPYLEKIFKVDNSKIKYKFELVGGISYEQKQINKHTDILDRLQAPENDIVGTLRLLTAINYPFWIDLSEIETLFKEYVQMTQNLPSNAQLDDWQEAYLQEDLKLIEEFKTEYLSIVELNCQAIYKYAVEVEYYNV